MVSFKLFQPGGATRRLTFPSNPTWFVLAFRAGAIFDIPVENVAVSYLDADGDDITLNTQEELDEFYETSDIVNNSVIRFTIKNLAFLRVPPGIGVVVQEDFEEIDYKTVSDHAPSQAEDSSYSGPTPSAKGKFRATDDDDASSTTSSPSSSGESTEVSLVDAVHVPLLPTLVPTSPIVKDEENEEEGEVVEEHPDPPLPGSLEPEPPAPAQEAPAPSRPNTQSLETLIRDGITQHFRDLDLNATAEYFRNGRFQSDKEALMEYVNTETQKAMDTLQNEYGGLEGIGRRVAEAVSTAFRAFAEHPGEASNSRAGEAANPSTTNEMDVDAQNVHPPTAAAEARNANMGARANTAANPWTNFDGSQYIVHPSPWLPPPPVLAGTGRPPLPPPPPPPVPPVAPAAALVHASHYATPHGQGINPPGYYAPFCFGYGYPLGPPGHRHGHPHHRSHPPRGWGNRHVFVPSDVDPGHVAHRQPDPVLGAVDPGHAAPPARTEEKESRGYTEAVEAAAVAELLDRPNMRERTRTRRAREADENDPPLAPVAASGLFRSHTTGSGRGVRPGARSGWYSWASWNPKYGHDRESWRRQGHSEALYDEMVKIIRKMREMGFVDATDERLFDLVHKQLSRLTNGKFDRTLTSVQETEVLQRVVEDLVGEQASGPSRPRRNGMPGEW